MGIHARSGCDALVPEYVLDDGQRHTTQQADGGARYTAAVHGDVLADVQTLQRSCEQ